MHERLPETLRLAEERQRELYGVSDQGHINRILGSFRDFVALCEAKEYETGEPVRIIADF